MGIKIKNLQTGEFEKFNIPALKGEKGEPGEIEPSEKVDYIGKQHSKLRDTMNANVDYIIKTAIGEFNYLDYEGQHITATNSIEGHAKSAILKGQTLVNLIELSKFVSTSNVIKNGDTFTVTSTNNNAWFNSSLRLNGMSHEKTYIACWNSLTYTHQDSRGMNQLIGIYSYDSNRNQITVKATTQNQTTNYLIFTLPSNADLSKTYFRVHATTFTGEQGSTTTIKGMKVLEYQDGMENWDIPYFEGMQSVKTPVLTTIGSNLISPIFSSSWGSEICNYEKLPNGYVLDNTISRISYCHNLDNLIVGKKYTFSCDVEFLQESSNNKVQVYFNDSSGGMYGPALFTNGTLTWTFTYNKKYDSFGLYFQIDGDVEHLRANITNARINSGGTALTYEPYKSNILTVNEDVTLSGIGDVKDTLDCLTGEKVERVGEVVLDGSQNLSITQTGENTIRYQYVFNDKSYGFTNVVSDILPTINVFGSDMECISGANNNSNILFRLSKEKATNVQECKQYLQQNPITVHYERITPTVKTVDLSDNHVYSYKDVTHYDCSSAEGSLVPTLSVKVPTDTQLTIKEQKATTQTLLIKNMDLQQSIKEVQAMNLAFNTALYNSFNSIREEVEDIKKHVSTNENLEGSF